jgi:TRAP-type C4-dicarboxylate transport system permease small subunit
MRKFLDGLYCVLQWLLTLLIGVLIFPVTLQILARFTDVVPDYIWTEEMSRLCLIWIIMIGASVAVRDGTHFDVDVLPLPRTAAGVAIGRLVVHFAILLVALIFLAVGWRFTAFGYQQSSELSGLNMNVIHIAWPFAGFTWLVFLLEKFYDDIRLIRQAEGAPRAAR